MKVNGTVAAPVTGKPVQEAVRPVQQPAQESRASAYTVKAGDTLSGIARSLSVTVNELKEWNQLSSDIIFVNQRLSIQKADQKPVDNTIKVTSYTVQPGDTLSHLARRFNTTARELMTVNSLSTDLIFVNQQLQLPQ
nr:LysM peptidoglycan-binding domain-containing protein [Alkalibacterium sp. AK22]